MGLVVVVAVARTAAYLAMVGLVAPGASALNGTLHTVPAAALAVEADALGPARLVRAALVVLMAAAAAAAASAAAGRMVLAVQAAKE